MLPNDSNVMFTFFDLVTRSDCMIHDTSNS